MNPETFEASAYWASYFINNDSSGLTDAEIALADAWLVARGLAEKPCVDVGEPFFSWSYGHETGAECDGGDLAEYTFLV